MQPLDQALDAFANELGFIVLQTRREFEMPKQWRNWRPGNSLLDQAVESSENLDRHLSDSIQEMRAARSNSLPHSPFVQLEKPAMTAPGSFAASLKAMMDEAKAGLAQARTDGMAQVGAAVEKLNEAKTAVTKVTGSIAKTIEDEAASTMSELGQISNSLGDDI